MLPAHRLGVYWGTTFVPVKYTYIESAEGGCNWLLSADLKCGRFSFVRHRSRNIRDPAAQSRRRSSAQRLLCLLCAGACGDRDVNCAGKPKNDVAAP